jgi:hypothetical protein
VLHSFVALSFGTLFSFITKPRLSTSAFCALFPNDTFIGRTFNGDQWNPDHVNPVVLLHD